MREEVGEDLGTRDDSKDALFLHWARLDVGVKSWWVLWQQGFGQYQMVGINVDVCFVPYDSDRGNIGKHREYSGWPRIEISGRQVVCAVSPEDVVTVAVVEVDFIPVIGVIYM